MTEWLRIMLEEIERRRRAERDALQEHEQRLRERSAGELTRGSTPAGSTVGRRS
jgi:hypothetical protein